MDNDHSSNGKKILVDMGVDDRSLIIAAFAAATEKNTRLLKDISDNTKEMKDYFHDKDGFTKDLAAKLDENRDYIISQIIKNNKIFFAGISSILVIISVILSYIFGVAPVNS